MAIAQRLAKSEQHFYLRHLYKRGWKKIQSETIKGGNVVTFIRETKSEKGVRRETLKIKYMDNGWITLI